MPRRTIHAARGDAPNWRSVFDRLDGEEYAGLAPAVPLRGVGSDGSSRWAVIDQLDAPVLLVGLGLVIDAEHLYMSLSDVPEARRADAEAARSTARSVAIRERALWF